MQSDSLEALGSNHQVLGPIRGSAVGLFWGPAVRGRAVTRGMLNAETIVFVQRKILTWQFFELPKAQYEEDVYVKLSRC